MNHITIIGKTTNDAKVVLVKTNAGEMPLVTFTVLDFGMPYQKSELIPIEVHFAEEAAMHIHQYLKRGKDVAVDGILKMKKLPDKGGEERPHYYIAAKAVLFIGRKESGKNDG